MMSDSDEEEKSSRKKTMPKFDPLDGENWKFVFKTACGPKLVKIIEGLRIEPVSLASGADAAEVKKFNKKVARFKELNSSLYQNIVESLQLFNNSAKSYIDGIPMFDGKAAWDKLLKVLDDSSVQNKFNVLLECIRCNQDHGESVQHFNRKFESLFNKLVALKVSFEDLKMVLFISNLNSDFKILKTSLLLKTSSTMEELLADCKSYETRMKIEKNDEDRAIANSAKAGRNEFVQISNEEYLRLIESNNSGESALYVKPRLDHTISKHPNNPTEFERTLICRRCGKKGHAIRTCTAAEKDDSGEDTSRKQKKKKHDTGTKAFWTRQEVSLYAHVIPTGVNSEDENTLHGGAKRGDPVVNKIY